MILERLYIENYKQLRDPVELHPPEGAIGVVGSNGTGKSTLFESILWAFFGSRGGGPRFANELIPWSGGSTKDTTVVEVTLALGDDSYTVRRQLKSGSTGAEARDGSGKTIVEGLRTLPGGSRKICWGWTGRRSRRRSSPSRRS